MKCNGKLLIITALVGCLLLPACNTKRGNSRPSKEPDTPSENPLTPSEEPIAGWTDPTYSWSDDHSSCYAIRYSTTDSSVIEDELAQSKYTSSRDPDCETDGLATYTAEFVNPAFEKQVVEVVIPASGHNYGEPQYDWSGDGHTCTATRVCLNNASHVETETVKADIEIITPATYESAGEWICTASFTNPAFTVQTITIYGFLDDLEFVLNTAGTGYSVKMRADAVSDVINIPSTYNSLPVTDLEKDAFSREGCNVKKVVIPSSVTNYWQYSFRGNKYIEEIDGLPRTYYSSFTGCTSLKKITLQESCNIIYGHFFYDTYIEEAICPGVETVEAYMVDGTSHLKTITFGKNLTTVNKYAFSYDESLENIYVDPECTKFVSDNGVLYGIEETAKNIIRFPSCHNVKNYTLLPGTAKAAPHPFAYTKYLEEVTMSHEYVEIGSELFYRAYSIKKIVFTNADVYLDYYGSNIFTECKNLQEVVLPSGSDYLCQDGLFMSLDKTTIYYMLGGYTGEITIPKETIEIENFHAFRVVRCSGFKVEDGNECFSAVNGVLYNKSQTCLVKYPYRPNETVFNGSGLLSSITTLDEYSLSGFDHITEMDFSNTNINHYVFGSCSISASLTKIKFPTCVNNLGAFVVSSCPNMSELVFPVTKEYFLNNVTCNDSWREGCASTCNLVFTDATVNIMELYS